MRAFLFNNERFKVECGKTAWGKENIYDRFPHLYFELDESGIFEFELLNERRKVLFSGKAEARGAFGRAFSIIELPEKFEDAKFVRINGKLLELPEQVRVHGRITDFSGKPLKNAVIYLVTNPSGGFAGALTDNKGHFELYAPKGYYNHIFACDCAYGRKKLEFYGWHLHLHKELELNIRVDKIEIYRLTVAVTPERTLLVDFTPMDVVHTVKKGTQYAEIIRKALNGEHLKEGEIDMFFPKLSRENVNIYLDDRKLRVLTFQERYHSLENYGIKGLRRGYVLETDVLDVKPGVYDLRIVVSAEFGEVKEHGEAMYFGVKVW